MGVSNDPGLRRAWQIQAWTFDHPEVTRWLVLDDLKMPRSSNWKNYSIRTDENTGITDLDVLVAISLLGAAP